MCWKPKGKLSLSFIITRSKKNKKENPNPGNMTNSACSHEGDKETQAWNKTMGIVIKLGVGTKLGVVANNEN